MKKYVLPALTAVLCLPATNASAQPAQTNQFIRNLNLAKIERVVPKGAGFARRIPGVYIPAGTSWISLERKVATAAQTAGFNFNARDARVIAYNPALLRQFEQEVGHPLFEGRPLSYEKGLAVLRKNQAQFAQARANNEYAAKWEEFTKEHSHALPKRFRARFGNNYYKTYLEFANDVYQFYMKYIGLENLPRLRNTLDTDVEKIVCEFPIDSFRLIETQVDVPAKDYVIILTNRHSLTNQFSPTIEDRELLEKQIEYRVIK